MEDSLLNDLVLLNDGAGNYKRDMDILPPIAGSKSCVVVLDFNKDGFDDLFVGGRVVPGSYPQTPQSFLLQNDQNAEVVLTGLEYKNFELDADGNYFNAKLVAEKPAPWNIQAFDLIL